MKYHVARNGQQIGILLEYEVRDGLKSGELRPSDLFWREGMPEWLPLSSAPDVVDAISLNPYAPPLTDVGADGGFGTDDPVVLATLQQRLSAALMDFSCGMVCLALSETGQQTIDASGQPTPQGAVLLAIGGLAALVLLIWNVTLLITRGQTIGKRWMNIRIADYKSGANPGFVKVILLRGVCNGLISLILSLIPYAGLAYVATDIGFIFRPDRRCLHDLLAGTHVVRGSLPKR